LTARFADEGPIEQVHVSYALRYLPDVEVATEVVHHVALGAEREPATLGAGEGPLARVNEHVRPQVLLLRERLSATVGSARVRLSSIVDMHVRAVTI
jgi:hypothetical protein